MMRKLGQKGSMVDKIISEMKRSLIAGELNLGDKLPPEMELAERLGVSRNVVRESIKMLIAMGIVDIKRGDGTYIKQSISSNILDPLILKLLFSKGDPQTLLEFRQMVELGSLHAIINNVEAEDIRKMEEANRELENEAQKEQPDFSLIVDLDLSFHFAFINSSHNSLIQILMKATLEMFSPLMKEFLIKMGAGEAVKDHKEIIEAVRERNWEKANEVLLECFDSEKEYFKDAELPAKDTINQD